MARIPNSIPTTAYAYLSRPRGLGKCVEIPEIFKRQVDSNVIYTIGSTFLPSTRSIPDTSFNFNAQTSQSGKDLAR